MTQSKAQIVIDQAGQHIPTEKMLAFEAIERYQNHLDEYDGQHAVVQDILEVSQDVGDPLALDPTVSSDETHYKDYSFSMILAIQIWCRRTNSPA